MSGQIRGARNKAWKRQKGQCFYCNGSVAKHKATLDHRVPKCTGANLQDNAVMACRRCNEAKGDMPEEVFRDPERRASWRQTPRPGVKIERLTQSEHTRTLGEGKLGG